MKYSSYLCSVEFEKGLDMEANEALIAILKKSHAQAMAGQTVTMDEVEHFMSDKVYELTNPVDAYCVAEPF